MRFGIDLGGTKIEIIALDDDGAERLRERVATPQGDYPATVASITGLVKGAEQKLGAGGTVGVGIPGAESKATGLIKNANSNWLIGQPLRRDLEAALGRPVRIMNDANCFALSEAADGAAAGAEVVFGVILGTGVGGGIVVRGQVLSGINAIAGEWGHNPMPGEHHRPACYCGRKGCVELYLSGPGMARDHRQQGGAALSPGQIVAQAAAGDAECEATLARYEQRLARALATVINVVDPDAIVLGGGLSNIDRLYASVPALWGAHVFSDRVETKLARAKFGDSSGVRGAAWLW
ncbi:ROK family protein [Sulfurisoma sediminicola]|uniref:N-acetylglucosamine kinase n=1 Tax=Sulfurisoma sediminicola TaxID=1381557 RepID=A0A497XLG0_9PROT|nr:ROK family protein [Sulfurisoma sediminicola]RLJ68247.1 N-acetylglucosamine kinase [Sulfurisoma sediminicola]